MSIRILTILIMSQLWAITGQAKTKMVDREMLGQVRGTKIYCRVIGSGEPIVIVHGGPGMEHTYFLPQLLRLP